MYSGSQSVSQSFRYSGFHLFSQYSVINLIIHSFIQSSSSSLNSLLILKHKTTGSQSLLSAVDDNDAGGSINFYLIVEFVNLVYFN